MSYSNDIDAMALALAKEDLLSIPAGARRAAALADFAEIDPALASKLSLEICFSVS